MVYKATFPHNRRLRAMLKYPSVVTMSSLFVAVARRLPVHIHGCGSHHELMQVNATQILGRFGVLPVLSFRLLRCKSMQVSLS